MALTSSLNQSQNTFKFGLFEIRERSEKQTLLEHTKREIIAATSPAGGMLPPELNKEEQCVVTHATYSECFPASEYVENRTAERLIADSKTGDGLKCTVNQESCHSEEEIEHRNVGTTFEKSSPMELDSDVQPACEAEQVPSKDPDPEESVMNVDASLNSSDITEMASRIALECNAAVANSNTVVSISDALLAAHSICVQQSSPENISTHQVISLSDSEECTVSLQKKNPMDVYEEQEHTLADGSNIENCIILSDESYDEMQANDKFASRVAIKDEYNHEIQTSSQEEQDETDDSQLQTCVSQDPQEVYERKHKIEQHARSANTRDNQDDISTNETSSSCEMEDILADESDSSEVETHTSSCSSSEEYTQNSTKKDTEENSSEDMIITEETKSSSEEMRCFTKAQESDEDTYAKLRGEKEAQRIAEEAEEETRVQTEKVKELSDSSCSEDIKQKEAALITDNTNAIENEASSKTVPDVSQIHSNNCQPLEHETVLVQQVSEIPTADKHEESKQSETASALDGDQPPHSEIVSDSSSVQPWQEVSLNTWIQHESTNSLHSQALIIEDTHSTEQACSSESEHLILSAPEVSKQAAVVDGVATLPKEILQPVLPKKHKAPENEPLTQPSTKLAGREASFIPESQSNCVSAADAPQPDFLLDVLDDQLSIELEHKQKLQQAVAEATENLLWEEATLSVQSALLEVSKSAEQAQVEKTKIQQQLEELELHANSLHQQEEAAKLRHSVVSDLFAAEQHCLEEEKVAQISATIKALEEVQYKERLAREKLEQQKTDTLIKEKEAEHALDTLREQISELHAQLENSRMQLENLHSHRVELETAITTSKNNEEANATAIQEEVALEEEFFREKLENLTNKYRTEIDSVMLQLRNLKMASSTVDSDIGNLRKQVSDLETQHQNGIHYDMLNFNCVEVRCLADTQVSKATKKLTKQATEILSSLHSEFNKLALELQHEYAAEAERILASKRAEVPESCSPEPVDSFDSDATQFDDAFAEQETSRKRAASSDIGPEVQEPPTKKPRCKLY